MLFTSLEVEKRRSLGAMLVVTVVAAHGCTGKSDMLTDAVTSQGSNSTAGAELIAPLGGDAGNSGSPDTSECESVSDCFLASDCCYCQAMPHDAVWGCPADCGRLQCDVLDIDESDVLCLNGRCVLDRACSSGVTCDEVGPTCLEDTNLPPTHRPSMRATIEDGCWSNCIAASECSDLSE